MRTLIILLSFLLPVTLVSQLRFYVDTADISELETGIIPYSEYFFIEYLDCKLNSTTKGKAQLKRYTFYQRDIKCKLYPTNSIPKKGKLAFNNRKITHSDQLSLMNGVYKLIDKKGRVYEEILYHNGFIKKHIIKGGSFWHPRYKGKIISEIAEYDYSVFPFKLHYISYRKKGKIKSNYYVKYNGKDWLLESSSNLISTDIYKSVD